MNHKYYLDWREDNYCTALFFYKSLKRQWWIKISGSLYNLMPPSVICKL